MPEPWRQPPTFKQILQSPVTYAGPAVIGIAAMVWRAQIGPYWIRLAGAVAGISLGVWLVWWNAKRPW